LNNPKLIKPFQERFGTKIGRKSIPVSSYLVDPEKAYF
jgi:hypothetical protein